MTRLPAILLSALLACFLGCGEQPKRLEVGKWTDKGTKYVGVYFAKDIAKRDSYRTVASVAKSGWRVEYVRHYRDPERRVELDGYSSDSSWSTDEVLFGGFYPEHVGRHYFTVELERVSGAAEVTPEDVLFEIGEVE